MLNKLIHEVLAELREELQKLYGTKLKGVYLYGSFAQGMANEDSDIDLLIVLEGDVNPGEEISRMNPIVSEICLRHDLLISVYPVFEKAFQGRQAFDSECSHGSLEA